MPIDLTYNGDLSRIQIAISGFPNGLAHVEWSTNQLFWQTIRGGLELPIVDGAGSLDFFEFASDVQNFIRVSSVALEDAVDVFTSSGTWNKPIGLVAVRVTCVGGGGGSGGALGGAGSGISGASGGGEGAIAVIDAASLGPTETVTVGAGGSGGTAGDNPGSTGGQSSFGAHVSANGGNGGNGGGNEVASSTNDGGFGGSGGGGTAASIVHIQGGDGSNGQVISAVPVRVGSGGTSILGGGGRTADSFNEIGAPGRGFGGGGGSSVADTTNTAGAPGAGGIVVVENIFAGDGS